MPRRCSICSHSKRRQIDSALASGDPIRGISRKYRVSEDALSRHKSHVAEAVSRAAEKREENIGETILQRLENLCTKTENILAAAERSGDGRLALQAIKESREMLASIYTLTQRLATDNSQGCVIRVIFGDPSQAGNGETVDARPVTPRRALPPPTAIGSALIVREAPGPAASEPAPSPTPTVTRVAPQAPPPRPAPRPDPYPFSRLDEVFGRR
jgi:hypothetical protein